MKLSCFSILFFFLQFSFAQVVINEYSAANYDLTDFDPGNNAYEDWIELYNTGSTSVSLNGYFLSDKLDNPQKWEFPNGASIPANGYLVILADNDDDFAKKATIQSKVITDSYLKVFKIFTENVENQMYNYHPSLKPKVDKRGFSTDLVMFNSTNFLKNRDSLTKKYLEIFNKTHQVYIDTLKFDSDFLIAKNKKDQIGFETYINIKNLSEGKHIMKLKRLRKRKKDTIKVTDISIPFWYFKQ